MKLPSVEKYTSIVGNQEDVVKISDTNRLQAHAASLINETLEVVLLKLRFHAIGVFNSMSEYTLLFETQISSTLLSETRLLVFYYFYLNSFHCEILFIFLFQ